MISGHGSKRSSRLREFSGVKGTAFVSEDGRVLHTDFLLGVDPDTFGAAITTLFAASRFSMRALKRGRIRSVVAETNEIRLVLMEFQDVLIVVILDRTADMNRFYLVLSATIQESENIYNQ